MTHYPNREHKKADDAARRRALKALDDLGDEIRLMRAVLERGSDYRVDGDMTQTMAGKVRDLTDYLATLAALYDVREWAAADQAEIDRAVRETRRPDPPSKAADVDEALDYLLASETNSTWRLTLEELYDKARSRPA